MTSAAKQSIMKLIQRSCTGFIDDSAKTLKLSIVGMTTQQLADT